MNISERSGLRYLITVLKKVWTAWNGYFSSTRPARRTDLNRDGESSNRGFPCPAHCFPAATASSTQVRSRRFMEATLIGCVESETLLLDRYGPGVNMSSTDGEEFCTMLRISRGERPQLDNAFMNGVPIWLAWTRRLRGGLGSLREGHLMYNLIEFLSSNCLRMIFWLRVDSISI